ncbi:MAG: hypothetical protein OXN23_03795 [Gammaproteobacteria bacterium]|nr:hypothetical protein [Gammaproteobacteria bacterium]
MSDQENTQKGKSKPRSPAYPGIGLEEATTRARQIYSHERQNKAYVSAIYSHWSYTKSSGRARIALASLKYYGLINIEGSGDNRIVQLTNLALDILLDNREDSSERENAIQRAALAPTINSDLWNKYQGHLPSDQSLKFSLQRELGFTERGVEEYIEHFRSTLEFAKLTPKSYKPESNEDKLGEEKSEQLHTEQITINDDPPPSPKLGSVRNVQLPLSSDSWAILSAQFPITEKNWDQMLAVLQAMKPALIKNEDKAEENPMD